MSTFRSTRRITVTAMAGAAALTFSLLGGGGGGGSNVPVAEAAGAITWADEFDGPAGAPVDAGRWNSEVGGGGWGNNELQYYTDSTRNAVQDGNGNLVITARRENPNDFSCHYGRCEYTSARLTTANKFTQAYGSFEARIKVPRGQGIWPAFWMLGEDIGDVGWPNSGEIDIMENIGREPNVVHGTIHGPGYSAVGGVSGSRDIGRPLADDFHVYGIEWSPDLIRWFIDGQEYHRATPADTSGPWVFDKPFFLILNVAVGGYWPGYPDASTQFPQSMVVDWVRASDGVGGGGDPEPPTTPAPPTPTPTPPPSNAGLSLMSDWNGKCIGVPGSRFEDGNRLAVSNCTGAENQDWVFANGEVRTRNGKCMDVAWGSRANGAAIQIADCSGSPAQQFVLSGAGDLVNPQADKCVDIAGWNPNDGAVLVQWECTGGANQKWTAR